MSDRPDSRIDDYNLIDKAMRSSDPVVRRQARLAKDRIDGESKDVREIRDRLVEAHRRRDKLGIEELGLRLKGMNGRRS